MKGTGLRWIVVAVAFLSLVSTFVSSSELDKKLRFLQPLLGTDWVGGYAGEDESGLKITLTFEPILDGTVIKYAREAKGADFTGVTHFFWNPSLGEVRFLSLNNRGIVGEGTVAADGVEIVIQGKSHHPGGSVEFKTILSIEETGTLRDVFLRKKDGEWVQGHIQEFSGH